MKNLLSWLYISLFGIVLIGCQEDINVNSPNKSIHRLSKEGSVNESVSKILSGTLGDFVWYDTNLNGQADPDESGVSGFTVELYACNTGNKVGETITSSYGYYSFNNLSEGTYRIKFLAPPGYTFTIKNASGVSAEYDSDANTEGFTDCINLTADGTNITQDAGIIKLQIGSASIGNFVWNDLNRNGTQDDGEPGIEGVNVHLYDCASPAAKLKETNTDATGKYQFTNLPAGDYTIKFVAPAGYSFTLKDQGADDEKDSNVDPATGLTACIILDAGITNLNLDAGLYLVKKVQPKGYGYWKTHSKYGPAGYDPTWALIGEDASFFHSGQTWFKVIKTEPRRGNVYYILAHQYIAARLNELAGSSVPAKAAAAIKKATELFEDSESTPRKIGKLRGNSRLRKEFLELASSLEKFNQGRFGRGHHHHD